MKDKLVLDDSLLSYINGGFTNLNDIASAEKTFEQMGTMFLLGAKNTAGGNQTIFK